MDWSPLIQALIGLAAVMVPIVGTFLSIMISEYTKDIRSSRLGRAAEQAAGQVVEAMADPRNGGTLKDAMGAVKDVAIQQATVALSNNMARTIGKLGKTPSQLEGMIRGELGKMAASVQKPAQANVLVATIEETIPGKS
jgi:hypothetical protein